MCWSGRVRRQGLEPRTRGLREARPAATIALAARTYRHAAQNAHGAQGFTSHPVHDPVHGVGGVPFPGRLRHVIAGGCQALCGGLLSSAPRMVGA
jgi:hypothetical protein